MNQELIKKSFEESNRQLEEYEQNQAQENQNPQPEETPTPTQDVSLEASSEAITKSLDPHEEVKESDNWRKAREARRKLELENEELRRQLEGVRYQPTQNQPVVEEDDDNEELFANVDEDSLPTMKDLKKLAEKNKKLAQKLKAERAARTELAAETKLRTKHPDFFEVVTEDSLRELAQKSPEVAQTILQTQDPYLKHVLAYEYIKLHGISNKTPDFMESKSKVINNLSKPKTIASITAKTGDKPLAEVNAYFTPMTQEEKARYRKMNNDIINGIV